MDLKEIKNAYGQILDFNVKEVVRRKKFVHVTGWGVSQLCKRAGIEFVRVWGYGKYTENGPSPMSEVVIYRRDKKKLTKLIDARNQRREKRLAAKNSPAALERKRQTLEIESQAAEEALSREMHEVVQNEIHTELFADQIRLEFPSMPEGLEDQIAKHACERDSGRVGTSDAENAHELAVRAHIRHHRTNYIAILNCYPHFHGVDYRDAAKHEAMDEVQPKVDKIIRAWKAPVKRK